METKGLLPCLQEPIHWTLTWARRIHSTPSYHTSQTSIFTLFPRQRLRLFPWNFPTKISHALPMHDACYMSNPSYPP